MPTESSYPTVDIPNVDLWGLMFEQKRKEGFSDKQGTPQTRAVERAVPYPPIPSSYPQVTCSQLEFS
jgi:hypothetical protein